MIIQSSKVKISYMMFLHDHLLVCETSTFEVMSPPLVYPERMRIMSSTQVTHGGPRRQLTV